VYPTSDGGIQMSWTRKEYTISLNIYDKTRWDWFSRDRVLDISNFEEIDDVICLPASLIVQLKAYQETNF